jgi:hypothetical protein
VVDADPPKYWGRPLYDGEVTDTSTRCGPPGYWEQHVRKVLRATWEAHDRRAAAALDTTFGVVAGMGLGEVHSTVEVG